MSTRSGSSTSPHGNNSYLVKRSYSTPCENDNSEMMDSSSLRKTPPMTPNKNKNNNSSGGGGGGKMIAIKILLLDDSVTIIQAQTKALGRLVFDQICKQLNVLESDYFGLEYTDENEVTYWLDLEKRLTRQVGLNMADPMLKFSVKFYTPDPSQLEEEFTRYLFSLQIKRDLATGVLNCNDNTAALMASFIVQAECGDFSEEDYPDASYLSVYKFVPHQNYDLERKIRENHKKHIGQSPAEADLHLLETARRTELYGIRIHPAKDEDGVNLNLSVCHMGVLVFQNMTKINTFSWAKIRKISFKRKRFILKLHPETYQYQEGYYKELVEFIFDSRNECKAYWKRCVEHHAFFRCEKAPNPIHRSKGILSSRGSSFRYSGRTQKQMVAFVRENFIKRPPTNQYHSMSQQNLSTMGGVGGGGFDQVQHNQYSQQQQMLQFQRSSSFKSQQQRYENGGTRGVLGSQQVVSNSRSSPAMITDERDQPEERVYREDEDIEDEEEEEEFSDYVVENNTAKKKKKLQLSPDTSVTSSPIRADEPQGATSAVYYAPLDHLHHLHHPQQHHYAQPHPQQQQQQHHHQQQQHFPQQQQHQRGSHGQNEKQEVLPPDWFYYLTKELLNTYRTYRKDLNLLKLYNTTNFVQTHTKLSPTFKQNIEDIKKEHWETRNGNEILYQLAKYFEHFQQSYLDYFEYVHENYEKICLNDVSNHYIGKCCLFMRPFEFVKFVYVDLVQFLVGVGGNGEFARLVDKLKNALEAIYLKSDGFRLDLMSKCKVYELVKEMMFPKGEECGGFLLQGILLKLNKKRGLQNRIFFLFRDLLAYGSRISSTQGFRLHGIILTSQMELNDNCQIEINGIPHSFVVNVDNNLQGNKILVLAAFNERDKKSWTDAIRLAISSKSIKQESKLAISTNYNSSEEFLKNEVELVQPQQSHRSNATTHVCWHRNLTVSSDMLLRAYGCTISGYLLRKFKNSPGWQRLWVVYTNICLYFYKSHETLEESEDLPLASLPLLGYKVDVPSEQDNIHKDHVFKLSFKNHVYFFRAESPFTFQRWVRALKSSSILV